MDTDTLRLPGARRFGEPELMFHPSRTEDRSPHPLVGLSEFGPFSRSLVNKVLDPIRVAAIVPHGWRPRFLNLLREMEIQHRPQERRNYLPEFHGFSRIFGLRAVPADDLVLLELDSALDGRVSQSSAPHRIAAEALTSALSALTSRRSQFDVLFLFLPSSWEEAFFGLADDDFDLHDYLKAVSAVRSIPLQIIREDKALSYPCRCSVMWRLSIALYSKAGGVPWKLADQEADKAFVGLSYAIRMEAGSPTFVTCCSQVFDSDGAGLEFILYETDQITLDKRNPFLTRAEMRRVMARSLDLYNRRHAGRSPKRVTIQKSTEFKQEEIDGCFDSWRSSEGLDLVSHI